MKKKIFTILLCLIVSLNSFTLASSETIQVTPDFKEEDHLESRIDNTVFEWGNPSTYYNHVSSNSLSFIISGNKAECTLTVIGYPEVKKISAYIYLQRYVLGKWTTIAGGTFNKQENATNIFFAPTKTLDTIGTYRFTTQIFVYTKDGSSEFIELASDTDVY